MALYRLGSICQIISGSTPKTGVQEYWNGDKKWITPAELSESDYIVYDTERRLTDAGVKSAGLTPLPKGTVILSSRAPIGKVAIAGCEMYCNQGFKNLVCTDVINNRYLYWYLKSKTDYLNSLGRGATFKEISKSIVSDIELNVPELSTQVERVAHLEKLQSIISHRRAQLAKLDELVKCRFVEMFGDPIQNKQIYKLHSFTEFAYIDAEMTTDYHKYANYPHIGIDSIEKETGRLIGYRTVAQDGVISGKYLFSPEHLIYSKIRPNLNKVACPDFHGVCSADSYPIRNKSNCNKYYLLYVLRSQWFLDYIVPLSSRTNLPKVNRKQIESFTWPLPPIELQNQFEAFVRRIDKLRFVDHVGGEQFKQSLSLQVFLSASFLKLLEQLLAVILPHQSPLVVNRKAAKLVALGRLREMADGSRRGAELLEQVAESLFCFCRR